MGLKDKLGKAGKKATSNIDSAASGIANAAKDGVGQVTDTAGNAAKSAANSVDDVIQRAANQFDDIKTDVKTDIQQASQKKPLFIRDNKKGAASPAGKAAAPDNKRLKFLIGLLSLLLLGLLGYAASLFLNQGGAKKAATDAASTAMESMAEQNQAAPVAEPTSANDAVTTIPGENSANAQPGESSMPNATEAAAGSSAAADADQLPEMITEPLPSDQVVAAEELDQLQDERDQMTEQEQLLQEQIDALEQMEKLKAERIAILEKRLAEAAN